MSPEEVPGFRTPHEVQYESSMFALGRLFQPRRILELGTHLGRSLVWYGLGSTQVQRIVSVDAEMHTAGSQLIAQEVVRDFGLHCEIQWLTGKTNDPAIGHLIRQYTYDFVHIDAEHTYPACKQDLALAWEVVEPRGVIVVHDLVMDCIRQAVEEFARAAGCPVFEISPKRLLHGVAILQKPGGGAPL